VWTDHSLNIWQQAQAHLPAENIARMDYIIDCSGGEFKVVKSPGP
jgi:hypothetical protein